MGTVTGATKSKINILFVCIHNSARSQMAEAFLKNMGDQLLFGVSSAGLEPGKLNPLAVESMKRIGIDISKNNTKSVSSLLNKPYDLMVFVCSESQGQSCPVVPYKVDKIYWDIEDPSTLAGTGKGLAKKIDKIRDKIKLKVLGLLNEIDSHKD